MITRSPVTVNELRDFLSGQLAAHEVPTRLIFVASLPRNDAGKVLKQEVRDMLGQQRETPLAH